MRFRLNPALAAGGLFFIMLLDLLLEPGGTRGMSLVAITGAVVLILLWRRLPAAAANTYNTATC